ncbi:MAG TPA: glycosyltransferase family 39 protein [Thermoanaerobaculia bacterium]|nr:glycosyltransferase family 39 protein [Thermoanaerobaculia bacterium]
MTRRDSVAAALLVAILAVAAFLRFDHLGGPSYWLDEILGDMLTTRYAASAPWWHWLTGLEREHGPLYYATLLAARAFGHNELAGRLPAALFGLATIPIVFLAARAVGGWAAGIAAAIVLAVSPLHVYYSREARPYALLMLLTALLLFAMLRNRKWLAIAAIVAMLYTTAVAGPLLLAAALICLVRRMWIVGGAAATAAALVPLLYRGEAQPGPPSLDEHIVTRIARALTVTARGAEGHEWTIAILFAFAIAGAIVLGRRDRSAAFIAGGMALLPIVSAIVALAAIGHWFAERYVATALIGFVVLAGVGMASIRWAWLSMLIAVAIAADSWTAARHESFLKLDWRAIGAALERRAQPGDTIVAAEQWSDVCVRYYTRHLPPRARIVGVNDVKLAEMFANGGPTWFVSAGWGASTVRDWICRYPLLLASELEDFRLHYAPSLPDFVQHRAAAEDLRALAVALGPNVALHSGHDDELFRGDGWQGPEGPKGEEFRWATAKEASLRIPRGAPRDRRVVVHALPLSHPSLPAQTMTLSVNGASIATVTMPPEWRDYAFDIPATRWREGLNELKFTFGRVTIPATIGFSDPRPLAVCFGAVSIAESGPAHPPPPVIDVRLADESLFRTRCALPRKLTGWRLREETTKALFARLGFDPDPAWRALHIEDAAAAIAVESSCESDRAFLDRAFYVIAERNPNPGELADLMPRLQRGAARVDVIARVLKAIDVRQKLAGR